MISRPIAFAVAFVLIVLIIQLASPRTLSSAFSHLFLPLWSGKDSAVSGMTSETQLEQENQALQEQLAQDQATASSSKALLDEVNELRSLLGRSGGTNDLVLADVLRRPPGSGYDYLILDIGSTLGVSIGDSVYSVGSIPVGQIVEADAHSSKAELYSSPGTSYDVLVGSAHVPATAAGQGGGFFSASVSRESGVSMGDEVIIPAVSSSPFGAVDAVISNPEQPFERILFSEGINPYQSLFMLVGTNVPRPKPFSGSVMTASSTSTTSPTSPKGR